METKNSTVLQAEVISKPSDTFKVVKLTLRKDILVDLRNVKSL